MVEVNVNIMLEKDGEVADVQAGELGTLRHTLDDPDSPVSKLHAGRQKKTDIDPNQTPATPRLGMNAVSTSYLASVALPSEQLIGGGKSIQLTEDQMAGITRKHEIDAYIKGATSIITPEKTGMKDECHLKNIEQAVHAVMHEVLTGMDVLRIPPGDIFHLIDTLRDHAFAYATHCAATGKPPCVDTLKNTMRNHKDVQSFSRIHKADAGTSFDMEYHPKTGVPSRTIIAGATKHHGVCHSRHGHYHYEGMDVD